MISKILNWLESKKNKQNINTSAIHAMTVSADFIGVNTQYGHFEIGDNIGISKEIQIDKYKIKIMGGIIVAIEEV